MYSFGFINLKMIKNIILSRQIGVFTKSSRYRKFTIRNQNNPYNSLVNTFERSNGNKMRIFSTNMGIGREFIKKVYDQKKKEDVDEFIKSYRKFIDVDNKDFNVLLVYKGDRPYINLQMNNERTNIVEYKTN